MIAEQFSGGVERSQKFTRKNPCPRCGGGDDDKRHLGIRCHWGFLSRDGLYVHCGNSDNIGGALRPDRNGVTYPHRASGPCLCGETHDFASAGATPRPANVVEMRPRTVTRAHQNHTPIATHVYQNRDRSIRFRVARFWSKRTGPLADAPTLPKCLPQREDTGWPGEWIDGLDGAPYAGLYLLPELVEADAFAPVFIPEGESCVDEIVTQDGIATGMVATCHAGGAKKWEGVAASDLEAFRGRQVVLLTDNDDDGRADTAQGVALLLPIAASVRMLALPGLPPGGDVVDWLESGHTIADLRRMAADAPIISAPSSSAQESRHEFQDEPRDETRKTCSGCERREEQNRRLGKLLRIADASLGRLRHERALEARVLTLPTATATPADKLLALRARRELTAPSRTRERDAQGRQLLYRAEVADWLGCSDSAAGKRLEKVCDLQLLSRNKEKRGFSDTVFYYDLGPLADSPEAAPAPKPAANTWGGKRVKACPHCRSANIVATSYTCRNCGSTMARHELIEIDPGEAEETPAEDATPTSSPPENPIVGQDGTRANFPEETDTYETPIADVEEVEDGAGHVVHDWYFAQRGARFRICRVKGCGAIEPDKPGYQYGYPIST